MPQPNRIERVAIIGATGRLGSHFVEELVKTGTNKITALTRASSKATLPASVTVVEVDYSNEASLTSALHGIQFLVITLSVQAAPDLHSTIVATAVKAGVPYIMPNAYGFDILNKNLAEEHLFGAMSLQRCSEIENLGAAYVAMCCGFWYEWSLALGPSWFGFDIMQRKVTFFDEGTTHINTSTWEQCGRALAALLSLPEEGAKPAVSDWKNKPFYISSFRVSQRDMLDSIHRVTGSKDEDWEIRYEKTSQRYEDGLAEMKGGLQTGFAKALYSRMFFPNGDGDFESSRELANGIFGLPEEELDEATKRAVDMVESGWNPFAQ